MRNCLATDHDWPDNDNVSFLSYILQIYVVFQINTSFLFVITAFGVDAAFSYKYNQQYGICNKDGLAICPGFSTTHVIPVLFP